MLTFLRFKIQPPMQMDTASAMKRTIRIQLWLGHFTQSPAMR
jgi:hypothetical protein